MPGNRVRPGFLPAAGDPVPEEVRRELARLTARVEQLERELDQLRRGVRHLLGAEVRGDHERRVLEARLIDAGLVPRTDGEMP